MLYIMKQIPVMRACCHAVHGIKEYKKCVPKCRLLCPTN